MTSAIAESVDAKQSSRGLSICVFCGAGQSNSQAIVDVARTTGQLIGERQHRLIYGGGGSGLMGEVAWAASKHGATIRGIIPRFLYERERAVAAPTQELVLTNTLHKRKEYMLRMSDAFFALPGGFGTLDEILEVISATYLGLTENPVIIVNAEGIWNNFIDLIEAIRQFDLITDRKQPMFHIAAAPEEAMTLAERLVDSET
jgi:cytokinin riboside 5'-monophosphate phosphoribohydrolase